MSYTVCPYLVNIDDLKKAVGSKDRSLGIAVLKKRAKENGELFDENEWDHPAPKNEEEDEEDEWNTVAAVKALIKGNLKSKKIEGHQYGYALEAICGYFGKRCGVEALEDVRSSGEFIDYWSWLFAKKPLVPFNGFNDGDFPSIGYLHLADLPAEMQRTKELEFHRKGGKGKGKSKSEMSFAERIVRDTLKHYSEDYETVEVSHADFPWLDESYYDSVQRELKPLGFCKIRDEESLNDSRLRPQSRRFSRLFVNAERNIALSISQIGVIKPKNNYERELKVGFVEITSEFSDGTFLVTSNGIFGVFDIDGITYKPLGNEKSLSYVLEHHTKFVQRRCDSQKTKLRTYTTDKDLHSMGERRYLLMRADAQKKLNAMQAGTAKPSETENWLEEIRTGLLALYKKAMKAKKDIVTFYY